MVGSDENNPGLIKSANVQGDLPTLGGKFAIGIGQNRRPLSTINHNNGAPPLPCVVNKKGGLSEKHAILDKSRPIPTHRPLTRKFAAQLARKQQQQPLPKETKKSVQSVPTPSEAEDCTIKDVDDYKRACNFPVPMFVRHTEAMMDEIDQMVVELEDIDEEQIVDIDHNDKGNPLAVIEYVDDIYAYYKRVEGSSCVSPNYMAHQSDINEKMRAILIDWLIEVHYKFELMDETLYLTINLIDRFLAVQSVVRKQLQLVGVTAMLLACKYEEVSVPVIEDLILISDKAYTRKEVLEMEKMMINTLKFNLSVPTPYVFMTRFLKAAQSGNEVELLSFFIIELCLVEYEMVKYPPSLLAAAAIFTAQCTLCGSKQWSKTSERYTNYSQDQLMECSRLMVTFHQNAGTGKLTGVYRKYSTSKYGYTAKSKHCSLFLSA